MSKVNALTVDVEDYFQVAAFKDVVSNDDWDGIPTRVGPNTHRLLDMFDAAGVRATFFVLGWVAEKEPEIVHAISERGHEIASHGMSHRLIYEQGREEFREETFKSKDILEQLTGRPVRGYRAASYSIVQKSLWALDIIAEAGFEYDSSIVPARHDLYGMPGAEPFPHRLRTPGGAQLTEFPPTTCSVLGRRIPVGGGGYFRLVPYVVTRHALRHVNETLGAPFIFYLHPWEVDPDQPRIRAGIKSRFRHYVNLGRTEPRLRRLVREFSFGTVSAVLEDMNLLEPEATRIVT